MDNLRRAILVFSAAVFVAAAVIGYLLALDYYNASDTAVQDLEYSGTKYTPSDDGENSKQPENAGFTDNILFIVGDGRTNSSELITIVNFDSEAKKITLLYVPCDMKYSLSGSGQSITNGVLRDFYASRGGDQTALLLSGLFGVNITKYIYMDFSEYATFINHFTSRDRGVEFDLPVALSGKEPGGAAYTLQAGKQYFDGTMAKHLAMFYKAEEDVYSAALLKYYDGSQTCRINMMAAFNNAFLNQKMIAPSESYYSENYYSLMDSVRSSCVTNLSASDLTAICAALPSFEKGCVSSYAAICDPAATGIDACVYTDRVRDAENANMVLSESGTLQLLANSFRSVPTKG